MGKSFRIKAIFLSLCIIISLFSGIGSIGVMASEDIFVGWDADLDFITLTFTEEINLTLLEESVSLTKDGEDVAVIVELTNHADVAKINKSYHMATEYTYAITPVEGMEADAIYTLSVDGSIFGYDDSQDFVKKFKVELLDAGMEYQYKAAANRWSYFNGNTGNILGELTSEDNKLVATMKMETGFTGYKNGRYVRHYPSSATPDGSLKDYTVKMTYSNEGTPTKTMYRLYTNFVKHNDCLMFYYAVNSSGNHDIRIYENESASLAGGNGMNASYFKDFALGDTVELKLSVRNGYLNAYINNIKVADARITNTHYGKAAFNISVDGALGSDQKITLSNYAMTQVVEYYTAEIDKTENLELTDSVKITLPKAVAEGFNPESYAVLTNDGEEVSDYSAVLSDDGTYVTVSFAGLNYKEKYDIEFPEYSFADGTKGPLVPVSFTTLPPEYDLESFVLTDANGEKLDSMADLTTDTFSVSAKVINNRLEEAKTATVTVAIYNDLGQMCTVAGDVYTLAKGEYVDVAIENFACESGRTYSAKCFVWDSFVGMKTIFEESIE